jgi:hypothetical protein
MALRAELQESARERGMQPMPIPESLRLVDNALQEFYCQPANAFHLPRPLANAPTRRCGQGEADG